MRTTLVTAAIIFALDQLSKLVVVHLLDLKNLYFHPVWDPFLTFRMAWNEGINFGLFAGGETTKWVLVGISVAISMAGQMGDVAESALKRRMGVKDSSNIIPGHGGMFDRFDAMLGAAIFLLLVEQIIDFPPAPVPL